MEDRWGSRGLERDHYYGVIIADTGGKEKFLVRSSGFREEKPSP